MNAKISVFIAFTALIGVSNLQGESIPAKVLKVDGEATVNIPGKGNQPLVAGALIPEGSEIKTAAGSEVVVGLTPGAGTILEENTTMEIEKLSVEKKGEKLTKREVMLNLKNDDAAAVSFLKSFDGVSDFKIKTTTGIAAARGTIWRTTSSVIQVIQGNVEFSFGGRTVSVPAGSATTTTGPDGGTITTLPDSVLNDIINAVQGATSIILTRTVDGNLIIEDPTTATAEVISLDEVNSPDQ
ncbi:MAG: hypothetical protein AAF649_01320 [Verrucomicrobiota bacterium]